MKVYFTSDTHSYIFPYDYIHEGIKDMGYAHLASAFSDDAIIIDGGDVLQGSPVIRQALLSGKRPLPMAALFNTAGLSVFTPGNHDFDFGYDALASLLSDLDAVPVAANVEDERGFLGIRRHVMIEKGGVRIFITGAVTDYVGIWDGEKLDGLRITDSVEALRSEIAEIATLRPDWSICIYHGGFGGGMENRGEEIAKLGFDYLLTAHQHQVIEPFRIGGTIALQAGCRGEWAAELELGSDGSHSERLIRCSSSTPLKEAVSAVLSEGFEEDVNASLSAVIGHVDGTLEDRGEIESAIHGSSLADFINDIQISLTGADISVASLANEPVSIGPRVTLGSALASYPFSNNLTLLSMNAGLLRRAMERSARFIDSSPSGPVLSPFFSPGKKERYNYDFYRGLSYSFDYRREGGSRVVRMVWNGIDLLKHPETMLRVVVNSYRACGTGGYDAYSEASVIRTYSEEMQDLLIDALSHAHVALPSPTDFSTEY